MKVVLLSSMYGASKFGLSRTLGISVDEAEEFRQTFFDTYKRIGAFSDKRQPLPKRNGSLWLAVKPGTNRFRAARKRPKPRPHAQTRAAACEAAGQRSSLAGQT